MKGSRFILGDFNARLGIKQPGEESVLGDFGFGRQAQHSVEVPNRDLLLEYCTSVGYVVANTQTVTYHEPRVAPMSAINENDFSVLDVFLTPAETLSDVI